MAGTSRLHLTTEGFSSEKREQLDTRSVFNENESRLFTKQCVEWLLKQHPGL